MPSLKNTIRKLPDSPGVYLFLDRSYKIIYIGKATSLKKRVSSYFSKNTDSVKIDLLVSKIAGIKIFQASSELEALLLESRLIKKFLPRYNIDWKDDKAYPYLVLTIKDAWPRLAFVRRVKNDGNLYFGPFRTATARELLKLAKRFFPLRWCKKTPLKKRKQGCLQFHIGNCLGPCIGKVSPPEYKKMVLGIKAFLGGKTNKAVLILQQQMEKASKELNFERAAKLRNKISEIERFISEGSKVEKYRLGDQRGNLEELKAILHLKTLPRRIEAFDISNTQSHEIVGAMVAFTNGLPDKKHYRKFKIRTRAHQDDVGAIYEIVKRRYTGTLKDKLPFPDLILIDGGIAQVNAASLALRRADASVPVVSIAKKNEELFFPNNSKPLSVPKTSAGLKLLQRIRDEVHRFVISYHRARRGKALFSRT